MAIDAVVDTEAEVSVLSSKAYQLMNPMSSLTDNIAIVQAGEESKLDRFIAEPFNIRIGPRHYEADLRVIPFKDWMLL